MTFREIGLDLVSAIFVFIELAIYIGLPALFINYLIIRPILLIKREMKSGKTLWQALKEVYNNNNTNATGHLIHSPSTYNTNWRSSDYTINPLHSSMPGNIYNRR